MRERDLNCPYCRYGLDVCHDDGQGYDENVKHQMNCDKCGKDFVFNTIITFDYEPFKADCLNGQEHDYEPTACFPKELTRMRCNMCDDERELTDEERKQMGIGSIQDYIDNLKNINID